ncbi:hypothetical protein PMAYCL1PPCAC_05103, partial [Pristionchus mayeri]
FATSFDLVCVGLLLIGVIKEIRLLVVPFIIDQILSILLHVLGCIYIATTDDKLKYSSGEEVSQALIFAGVALLIVLIIMNAYFLKIAITFYSFLERREHNEERTGYPSDPIVQYQVSLGPAFPSNVPEIIPEKVRHESPPAYSM